MSMIRHVFFTILVVLIGTHAAAARNYEWMGSMIFTNLTSACIGWSVGDYFMLRYRPPLLGDNPNETRLAFFSRLHAHAHIMMGDVGKKFVPTIRSARISSSIANFDPGYNKVRFLERTPARITTATTTIALIGEITNFDGYTGCTAKFQASLGLRP